MDMEKLPIYAMSVEDFLEHLEKRRRYDNNFDCDRLIVKMIQKEYNFYSEKDTFITFNIILEYDCEGDCFIWEWDFYEGQDTFVLGYICVRDIEVPSFAQILK